MKNFKRIVSLLLAMVMVFALNVTAFADDPTGTITVQDAKSDTTYTAYKIFDLTYNSDKTAYAYSIASDSEWYSVVSDYAATAGSGLTLTQNADNTYNVSTGTGFSAAAFAATLNNSMTGKTGTALVYDADTDTASADSLALGYYLVDTTLGALCSLTSTDPDASIRDKNDVPFEKTDDGDDVEIGQTVNYTLTGKVPDTTGFASFTYKITDTMSSGLTFNQDAVVKVAGTTLASSNYSLTNGSNGFELTIAVMNLQSQVGEDITVEYSATVNENAVVVISSNNAKLEYSNNPNDSTSTTEITDEETSYSAKIVIDKYETGTTTKKLAGATFVLYKEEGGVKKYYKYTDAVAADPAAGTEASPASVTWVTNIADATAVTTADGENGTVKGAAEFIGLKNGTYKLHETEAPDGYNILTTDPTVTINNSSTVTTAQLTITEQVANSTGTELPATGGIGTTIFYVVGAILVVAAGVVLVTKRRVKSDL